ncbi:MAG: hypothetical protein F6K26_54260 [Moorea sp. SIO2I5]|nr:hypothetical protein [Moorena sp. SIO2I5]
MISESRSLKKILKIIGSRESGIGSRESGVGNRESGVGSQIRVPSCLLPIAYCLLPIAYCLLPFAFCLLPFASPERDYSQINYHSNISRVKTRHYHHAATESDRF